MRLIFFVLLLFSLTAAGAAADQRDARLKPLFKALKSSSSEEEAQFIERQIWGIWSSHGRGDEIDLRFRRGLLLMNAGHVDEAIKMFSQIVEIDPDFAEAWNKRATLRYMKGDLAGSVRDIEHTLSLEPRHFGALSGLGLIYDEIDSVDGAIKAFTAALEINPHMVWIAERLATLKEKKAGAPL